MRISFDGAAYQGAADQEISEIARTEGRLLITTDAGFLAAAAPFGAMVVRLHQPNRVRIHKAIIRGLRAVESGARWRGVIIEVRDSRVIVRR